MYLVLLYASVLIAVCVYICGQDPSSEERFHVELHFSPGVKSCRDEENAPMGFGFRPASSEVCVCMWMIIFHKDISTLPWNKNKMVQGNVWCECRTRRSRKTWAVWRICLRMNLIEPFTLSRWTFTKSPHWFGTEKPVPWRYCSLTQPLASVCSHPAQSF